MMDPIQETISFLENNNIYSAQIVLKSNKVSIIGHRMTYKEVKKLSGGRYVPERVYYEETMEHKIEFPESDIEELHERMLSALVSLIERRASIDPSWKLFITPKKNRKLIYISNRGVQYKFLSFDKEHKVIKRPDGTKEWKTKLYRYYFNLKPIVYDPNRLRSGDWMIEPAF